MMSDREYKTQWVDDLNYTLSVLTELQDHKDIFQMRLHGGKPSKIRYYSKYFAKGYDPDYKESYTAEELETEAQKNIELLEKRRHVRERQKG